MRLSTRFQWFQTKISGPMTNFGDAKDKKSPFSLIENREGNISILYINDTYTYLRDKCEQ